MSLNVLIVTDKFKGTLTAQAAAELIARGWREARPEDVLELLPMSDGGDGFGEVLGRLLEVDEQTVATGRRAYPDPSQLVVGAEDQDGDHRIGKDHRTRPTAGAQVPPF